MMRRRNERAGNDYSDYIWMDGLSMGSRRHKKSADDTRAAADQLLSTLFTQANAQFGDAVKSFWFHDGDLCPACMTRPIDAMTIKGRDALSLNAFIYRPHGVLIGYFLCKTCAGFIFKEAQENPYKQTPLHTEIERNLSDAYHRHLASLDA
jgi:hypothetical protein